MSTCSDLYSYFSPSYWYCSRAQGTKSGYTLGGFEIPEINLESFYTSFEKGFSRLNKTVRNGMMHTAAMVAGVSTAILVGQIALQVAGSYFQAYVAHSIGRPRLAIDFEFDSWSNTVYQMIMHPFNYVSEKVKSRPKPIFKAEIQEQIDKIQEATQNIRKHKGFFSNLLLYGPPGTGKTMVSKMIAKGAKMNYIMMSGGDLAQYIQRGEHVSELNTLFERVKYSGRPTIIFIDEAEGLAKNRKDLDMERVELLNAFLNHTGEPTQKFMLILATNRPEDIDSAVLSRMDNQIFVGPPSPTERLKIFKMYIQQFFKKKNIFTDELYERVNAKLEGFTGRDIFKLCNTLATTRAAQKNNKLTEELLFSTLDRVLKNRNEIQNRIASA